MDGTGRGRSKKEVVGEMPGSVPAREKLPTLCTGMAERQQLGREGKGQTQRQARAGWVGGGVVGPAMAVACFALSLSRFRRARGPALPGGHAGPTTEMLLRVTVSVGFRPHSIPPLASRPGGGNDEAVLRSSNPP